MNRKRCYITLILLCNVLILLSTNHELYSPNRKMQVCFNTDGRLIGIPPI